jgi:hypothetical protein
VGVGAWDKLVARYAYTQFADEADEQAGLAAIVREAIDRNLLFLSDADARSAGAAHPLANLWDNGADPIAELDRIMAVRRSALESFSDKNIPEGDPLALLENVLVPLYLGHRYQLDATAKSIGGSVYSYAMRGDGQVPITPVPAERQRAALNAMLRTIETAELTLDESILSLIPPLPHGYDDDRERFARNTGRLFDPLAAARVAAEMTVGNLLQRARAARLIINQGMNQTALSLEEVIDRLLGATWLVGPPSGDYEKAVARTVESVVLNKLIDLAGQREASTDVRAAASASLERLAELIADRVEPGDAPERAHHRLALDEITRFLDRPHRPAEDPRSLSPPPGSPIGD